MPWAFEVRSHRSEQHAIGWTIYNLYREVPSDFEGPDGADAFDQVAFPAVDDLAVGSIIQRCWRLQYPSIAALDDNFQKLFVMSRPWYRRVAQSLRSSWETLIDRLHYWVLRKHCKNLYARLCEHGLYALPLVSGSA